MRLNINVKEDEQLRKEIKTIIKGQVTAIVRDEIKTIILEVLSAEGKKLDATKLEQLAISEVKAHVKAVVNEGYSDDRKKLDKMIRTEVASILTEHKVRIEEIVTETVEGLVEEDIKQEIRQQVIDHTKEIVAQLLTSKVRVK